MLCHFYLNSLNKILIFKNKNFQVKIVSLYKTNLKKNIFPKKLCLFCQKHKVFLSGSIGTIGPGPTPLASRPSPRAPKGSGSRASRPRNAWSILRPGTPRELGPKANRPRNARPILRPGARVSHIPDGF